MTALYPQSARPPADVAPSSPPSQEGAGDGRVTWRLPCDPPPWLTFADVLALVLALIHQVPPHEPWGHTACQRPRLLPGAQHEGTGTGDPRLAAHR